MQVTQGKAHLNGRLVLTDCKLAVCSACGLAACDIFQLVLVPLDKAVIGELPPIRISLAEALYNAEK